MGSFELKVKRSVSGGAPVYAHAPVAAPAAPAPAATVSVDVPAPTVEDTVDESLVYVNAPKVRRGHLLGLGASGAQQLQL